MSTLEKIEAAGHAQATGRLDEAERLCREVLEHDPASNQAKLVLGITYTRRGDDRSAVDLLEQVVSYNGKQLGALLCLATSYVNLGQSANALRSAQAAEKLAPNNPFVLKVLGLAQLASKLIDQAADSFRRGISLSPNVGELHHLLGRALEMKGQFSGAVTEFAKAIECSPHEVSNHISLSRLYFFLNLDEKAAISGRKAVELAPQNPLSHVALAYALYHLNQIDDSRRHVQIALGLDPNNHNGHALQGQLAQVSGNLAEAEECFLKSLRAQPQQGYAYFAIVHNKLVTEKDRPLIETMEEQTRSDKIPAGEMQSLHYGLGKAYENLGEYEHAMAHYEEANESAYRIKFGGRSPDMLSYRNMTDRAIRVFNEGALKSAKGWGDPSNLPILVVGMLRSGTTLVEQILSSHPAVVGLGELDYWVPQMEKAYDRSQRGLNVEVPRILASKYLGLLKARAEPMSRVVDKMPANILAVGLIHMALPNARIIHIRRDPLDTCVSIFATPNRNYSSMLHSKDNITVAYEEYLRLSEHWRKLLPSSHYLEMDYEQIVENREAATRRLVRFCGLEWDDRCLVPEATEKTVLTPSAWQVRQPIYKTSVGRWKRFEPWLGPFARLRRLSD